MRGHRSELFMFIGGIWEGSMTAICLCLCLPLFLVLLYVRYILTFKQPWKLIGIKKPKLMLQKALSQDRAGSNSLQLVCDTAAPVPLEASVAFIPDYVTSLLFQLSQLTLSANWRIFSFSFHFICPFSLRSFLLFSLLLTLSLPIPFPLFYFCSPFLCVPCTSKARTWCWQKKRPLVPLGKPCSS